MLLQLIPYHMQETNFITQLILDIKLNHYLLSFWACRGMSDHTHLKQPTNICCFHGPLVTSKNSASYLNLFVRYSSLKNPAFWLVQRFLDHNWRTRFLPNILFLEKVKIPLTLSYCTLWVDSLFIHWAHWRTLMRSKYFLFVHHKHFGKAKHLVFWALWWHQLFGSR